MSQKKLMYVKRCKEKLRKRRMQQYLYALKEREHLYTETKKMSVVGSSVLLVEDTKNRETCKTGKIQQKVYGKDGVLRRYKINTIS